MLSERSKRQRLNGARRRGNKGLYRGSFQGYVGHLSFMSHGAAGLLILRLTLLSIRGVAMLNGSFMHDKLNWSFQDQNIALSRKFSFIQVRKIERETEGLRKSYVQKRVTKLQSNWDDSGFS